VWIQWILRSVLYVDEVVLKGGNMGGNTRGGSSWGVHMSNALKTGLTAKQTALVDNLVATGCSITEAAVKAGYAAGDSGRVTASKTLRLPHVQEYMMRCVGEALGLNATVAAAKLVQLARGAKSEYVQLEASKDILDRSGFKAPDRHMHLHAGEVSVTIDLS